MCVVNIAFLCHESTPVGKVRGCSQTSRAEMFFHFIEIKLISKICNVLVILLPFIHIWKTKVPNEFHSNDWEEPSKPSEQF